jgi:RNA polymerase sigma-70 factor (ECF subfamily)
VPFVLNLLNAMKPNLSSTQVSDAPDTTERDASLLRRIAMKDAAAFAELHKLYTPLLIHTVNRVLDDYQDTQDIVQEVFVALWQKAHLYEPSKGKPVTWMTTLARNRSIDLVRSRQRRSELNNRFENQQKVELPEMDERSADENLQMSERAAIVRRAVQRLSPSQREAIEQAFFAGKARKDMASSTGEPLGTVKARVRRGIKALGAIIEREL